MKTLVFLLAVVAFVVTQQAVPTDAVVKVRAVDQGDAVIPCGQSKIFLDGPDAFVSWVKDDNRVVYRFPIDSTNTDERSFNEICYRSPDMKPCRERTSLFLPHVTKDDAGFYRCRIHYNASPAVDFDFQLVIVERPSYPKVYIENEVTNDQDYIGPLPLGTNVTLVCEVVDSNENTVVQWERNGQKVVGSELVKPGLHRAVLRLRDMQREENGARYACIAQAGDVTLPLTRELEVKMYLPPQSIKIDMNNKYTFEAGVPRAIDCIIIGFIPTPTIEWYLDDKLLKSDTHQEIPGKNVTISTLTLVTKPSDDNRVLSCRAKNEYFDEVFATSVRLRVGFKPKCVLKTKHRIEIKPDILERVVCIVDSDPAPIGFTWTFSNTKIVATPVQDTKIPTRYTSILSWIPHVDEIGKLNCTATNYHGIQEEPCQFDIGRSDCTNGSGVNGPCLQDNETAIPSFRRGRKEVPSDNRNLIQAKITTGLHNNPQKPRVEENKNGPVNVNGKNDFMIDYNEGSHVIETHVSDLKDKSPWWVPLLFLLGSLFLIGVITYPIGHWVYIKCKDREIGNDRIAMTYSSAGRTRTASLASQEGPGSYHREPDVTERFTHQTNVTITPTSFASTRRNGPADELVSMYPICHETHTYCV